jgi:hypothetical protein
MLLSGIDTFKPSEPPDATVLVALTTVFVHRFLRTVTSIHNLEALQSLG